MRFQLHLSTRMYVILLSLMVAIFVMMGTMINSESRQTQNEIKELNQANTELSMQLDDLRSELEFIKTDAGIELYARAQGMRMPGETRYNPVRGSN